MAHARPAPSPSSSPSLLLFRSAHPSSPALCRLPPPGGNRPRRGGAASQVLSQLAREDRDLYFAEPLPIEWTLAMQYHSVVKEPMDFATMRGKVHDGEYGTDPRVAVPAFRADFELTVNNAMAFHRPNERCHIMAKRIQRFGLRTIRITFPWTEGLDEVGKAGKKAAAEKKAAESQAAAAGTSAATDAPEPLLESAWDYGAAVVWEPASAGPTAPDLCFVCGGAPHYGGGGGAVEAELLSCIHCAESFHVFCTPQPTATLTEETRLNWTCQRCRTQPMVPKLGGGAEPDAGASASAPSVDIRCLRCDKRRGNMDGFGGYATWVCTDCRCCESCGTLTGKTWSTDGIWCGLCAAAGLEGRYCAVCSKVYANDADEAQTMVACDRCGLWVHKECDGISQIEYQNYCDGAPGFERYECPDCRRDSRHHAPTVMRKIERLIYRIQTKRLAFSNSPPVAADEIGVRHHKLRYNSMLRWCSERAQAGAPWAQKWAPKADPRLLTLAAGNGGAEGGTEDGSDVGAGGGGGAKANGLAPPLGALRVGGDAAPTANSALGAVPMDMGVSAETASQATPSAMPAVGGGVGEDSTQEAADAVSSVAGALPSSAATSAPSDELANGTANCMPGDAANASPGSATDGAPHGAVDGIADDSSESALDGASDTELDDPSGQNGLPSTDAAAPPAPMAPLQPSANGRVDPNADTTALGAALPNRFLPAPLAASAVKTEDGNHIGSGPGPLGDAPPPPLSKPPESVPSPGCGSCVPAAVAGVPPLPATAAAAAAPQPVTSKTPASYQAFWSSLVVPQRADAKARTKNQRCGKCAGCTRVDCGQCKKCRDMVKFGGLGVMRQACALRVCVNPLAAGGGMQASANLPTSIASLVEEDGKPYDVANDSFDELSDDEMSSSPLKWPLSPRSAHAVMPITPASGALKTQETPAEVEGASTTTEGVASLGVASLGVPSLEKSVAPAVAAAGLDPATSSAEGPSAGGDDVALPSPAMAATGPSAAEVVKVEVASDPAAPSGLVSDGRDADGDVTMGDAAIETASPSAATRPAESTESSSEQPTDGPGENGSAHAAAQGSVEVPPAQPASATLAPVSGADAERGTSVGLASGDSPTPYAATGGVGAATGEPATDEPIPAASPPSGSANAASALGSTPAGSPSLGEATRSLFRAAALAALKAKPEEDAQLAPQGNQPEGGGDPNDEGDVPDTMSSMAGGAMVPAAPVSRIQHAPYVCALCGVGGASGSGPAAASVCGRLLPLGVGAWVHVNCALWSAECFEKELGTLYQVPTAVRRSRRTTCGLCGKIGASVGCASKRCDMSYHFACALKAGVTFTPNAAASTWCPMHQPLKKGAVPLPTYVDRSIRIKPLNRVHTLPPWQRAQIQSQPPPSGEPARGIDAVGDGEAPPDMPPPGASATPSASATPQVILRIGALRVLKLGLPQPGKAPFHDTQQVFPLGYLARRRFYDVGRPRARAEYLCEVRDSGGLPNFTITLERDHSVAFKGKTAVEAWAALMGRRYRSLHTTKPTLTPARAKLEASLFFGFGCPAVAQLIEQLPGAKACEGFRPRYSLPEEKQRAPPPPRSASGCARTEPIVRRSSKYKFEHAMYYRGFINRGSLAPRDDAATSEAITDERALSLNLRKRDGDGAIKSVGQVARPSGSVITMLRQPFPVEVRRSAIHNWGLFVTRPVPKDGMVVEYMGQALRNSIADHKEQMYEHGAFKGQGGDCYMFRLDGECVLDATMRGNVARFINHCCTPNCYSKVVVEPDAEPLVPGSVRGHIVIFAARDLDMGEEVTYDYKFPVEAAKIVCHCGSPKCLGVMN